MKSQQIFILILKVFKIMAKSFYTFAPSGIVCLNFGKGNLLSPPGRPISLLICTYVPVCLFCP
jgi:hypothetical protein